MSLNSRTLLCALAALAAACSDDAVTPEHAPPGQTSGQDDAAITGKATRGKAEAIARLFAPYRGIDESGANKAAEVVPEVSSVSFYVADGDTLLYAFNYGDNEGYIIVGGSTTSFPILAQSCEGRVDFDTADEGDPFTFFAGIMAQSVKERLGASEATDTAYAALWQHVDDPDYTYEVTPLDAEEDRIGNKGRLTKTGQAYIHPYTGLELKNWGQYGDYNSAAPNQACIGCPAVAIGMLIYDVGLRSMGKNEATNPTFDIFDSFLGNAKHVSQKLKQIADAIPNYKWGQKAGARSSATGPDIVAGLRRLGFTSARMTPYDFDTAYKNLSLEARNYFGDMATYHRGILLAGFPKRGGGGHIWFCDGYRESAYKVTRTYWKFLKRVRKTWVEYEDTHYMNWGQKGRANGWFHAKNIDYGRDLQMVVGLHEYMGR